MKTTIKTLSYLFVIIAGGILWASCGCDECENQKAIVQKELDSCKATAGSKIPPKIEIATLPQTLDIDTYTFIYDISKKCFRATHNTNLTTIEMGLNNTWVKITKTANNIEFKNENPPMGADNFTLTGAAMGDDAVSINLRFNPYRHANLNWGTDVFKIIGSDNGRNVNTNFSSPPGGQVVVGRIDQGFGVYVKRPSNTQYDIAQAQSQGLAKNLHNTNQVLLEKMDFQ